MKLLPLLGFVGGAWDGTTDDDAIGDSDGDGDGLTEAGCILCFDTDIEADIEAEIKDWVLESIDAVDTSPPAEAEAVFASLFPRIVTNTTSNNKEIFIFKKYFFKKLQTTTTTQIHTRLDTSRM